VRLGCSGWDEETTMNEDRCMLGPTSSEEIPCYVTAEERPVEPTWFGRLCCLVLGHVEVVRLEESVGELREPDGEPREVVVRLLITECLRCGKLIALHPAGVARDPARGGWMEKADGV